METSAEIGGDVKEVDLVIPGIVRLYKDGTIDRLMLMDVVPPSPVPVDGVSSKDVMVNIKPRDGQEAGRSLGARIFLPDLPGKAHEKLPLLLHFHGGGFFIGSPFSAIFNGFLMAIAAKAGVVVMSLDYRLAPEHPIPVAYEDSWETLIWVAGHRDGSGPESWLNDRVDFGKIFLGGESAGMFPLLRSMLNRIED
ncbi:hypothetical protein MLD38_000921 [Melastoma candidum]|uniref:Uncharacterized protein n=1 Tax=Melastoma candidum TaxID=119954 RepID=A0ACB9SFK2_9MYRT|nr:hypothetical protein MLD38_000921 [Melastoma candidum]